MKSSKLSIEAWDNYFNTFVTDEKIRKETGFSLDSIKQARVERNYRDSLKFGWSCYKGKPQLKNFINEVVTLRKETGKSDIELRLYLLEKYKIDFHKSAINRQLRERRSSNRSLLIMNQWNTQGLQGIAA